MKYLELLEHVKKCDYFCEQNPSLGVADAHFAMTINLTRKEKDVMVSDPEALSVYPFFEEIDFDKGIMIGNVRINVCRYKIPSRYSITTKGLATINLDNIDLA